MEKEACSTKGLSLDRTNPVYCTAVCNATPHLVALIKTRICSGAETNFTLVVRARPYLSSSCGRCHASVMHVPHVRTEMLLIAFTISFKYLGGDI